MKLVGQDLEKASELTSKFKQVRKKDLQFGDSVIVTTQNSTYCINVLENGFYLVSGGWFDLHGLSPMKTTISGCTWGGCIIKIDTIGVCGLCLEFGNRVVTTPIQKVGVFKSGSQN
jgi:hypothetical protein